MATGETKTEPLIIGDTTKKTINRTLAIGAALTAAVILTPAAHARETHHEPANGIQLATDIVNLVRAIVEPLPPPVIVEAPPVVVEKTVIVEKPVVVTTTPKVVTTTPTVVAAAPAAGTVIVTGAEAVTVPEYSYILYEDEYIPYYEGWLYYGDVWQWVGTEPRPAAPPRWKPETHRPDPEHHKVIVLPAAPRREPVIAHHEAPRREPVRTVVIRPDRKDAPRTEAPKATRPDKRNAPRAEAPKHDAPKRVR